MTPTKKHEGKMKSSYKSQPERRPRRRPSRNATYTKGADPGADQKRGSKTCYMRQMKNSKTIINKLKTINIVKAQSGADPQKVTHVEKGFRMWPCILATSCRFHRHRTDGRGTDGREDGRTGGTDGRGSGPPRRPKRPTDLYV